MSVDITLLQLDFLDADARNTLGTFDVIVSNPPYIAQAERATLHINVSMHEPALALFVPDNDPLVFYRALAAFGGQHLAVGGSIYCELDTAHAMETKELFIQAGYHPVILRKDINDNDRMLLARRAD
jgi:release factor glutamine methyltransferase